MEHSMDKYTMTREQFFDHLKNALVVRVDDEFYTVHKHEFSYLLEHINAANRINFVKVVGKENFDIQKVFDRSIDIFQQFICAFVTDKLTQLASVEDLLLPLYRWPDTNETMDMVLFEQLCYFGIEVHISSATLENI